MKQPNRFIQWMMYDWPVKVLSLLTAILLFFFVQLIMVEQRSFMVPLHVETQEQLYVSSSYPEMVQVTLTGNKDDVFMICPNDLTAVLDVNSTTDEGIITAPITIRKGEVLQGMKDVQVVVEPDHVRVQVEKKE